ncbi:Uncharacterized protein HZ326_1745 [Fusarium oxysporum f. sp. albedinis]|nr:Uncharacterized protein HZ326_1745 [Fusarium oxysporum f. sp. albedinis]
MHCRYVQHLSKRIEDLALIGIIEVITDMSECFADPISTSHRTIWPEQYLEQDKPVSEQTYQKFLTTCNG